MAKPNSSMGPQQIKKEYKRDYGQFAIAKIHSVHEDLGLVVGELDEKVMGVIPIEWFNKVDETWKPSGLACPYIYDANRRQWSIDKYEEIKDKLIDRALAYADAQRDRK